MKLDFGFRIPDSGFWELNFGCQFLFAENLELNVASQKL
ncbi:Uncharacterized protein dnm_011410 [Desulfonema magnum]|uniref:Uncharacterized protein n=1 Tax=Desulfonema magnum TaxID=45655 RepID=A0A975GKU9_9BACT|nr:Uncharacterized protein dnm_011410 [Desulfonema magnum]